MRAGSGANRNGRLGWRIVRDGDLQRERPGEGGARGDVASRKRHQAGRTPGRFGHGGVDIALSGGRWGRGHGRPERSGGRHPQRGDDHVALLMIRRTSWGRCVARPRENLPEWRWSWMPARASSPRCRWCRSRNDSSGIERRCSVFLFAMRSEGGILHWPGSTGRVNCQAISRPDSQQGVRPLRSLGLLRSLPAGLPCTEQTYRPTKSRNAYK